MQFLAQVHFTHSRSTVEEYSRVTGTPPYLKYGRPLYTYNVRSTYTVHILDTVYSADCRALYL